MCVCVCVCARESVHVRACVRMCVSVRVRSRRPCIPGSRSVQRKLQVAVESVVIVGGADLQNGNPGGRVFRDALGVMQGGADRRVVVLV